MREIEIKARVHDGAALIKKLNSLGIKLGEPVKQNDIVYGKPGAKDSEFNSIWLRIRTENDSRHILTLKKSVVGHLDSIEHETVVGNANEMLEIFKILGFEPYSDLTKIRRRGHYGEVEVCFDEVPGLGTFIEAEFLLNEDSEHNEVVDKLWEFYTLLGISKTDEVHEGYDVLDRRIRGL